MMLRASASVEDKHQANGHAQRGDLLMITLSILIFIVINVIAFHSV